MGNIKKYLRSASLAFAIILLLQCFIGISVFAEDGEEQEPVKEVELREMVCRIKNASTGLYLDSYKYTAKTKGKSYLESYSKGIEMIFTQLGDIFKKLGVEPFGEAGEAFDPQKHNAVMHIDSEDFGESVVAQVFAKGYKLGDKIIRCATVQVAN